MERLVEDLLLTRWFLGRDVDGRVEHHAPDSLRVQLGVHRSQVRPVGDAQVGEFPIAHQMSQVVEVTGRIDGRDVVEQGPGSLPALLGEGFGARGERIPLGLTVWGEIQGVEGVGLGVGAAPHRSGLPRATGVPSDDVVVGELVSLEVVEHLLARSTGAARVEEERGPLSFARPMPLARAVCLVGCMFLECQGDRRPLGMVPVQWHLDLRTELAAARTPCDALREERVHRPTAGRFHALGHGTRHIQLPTIGIAVVINDLVLIRVEGRDWWIRLAQRRGRGHRWRAYSIRGVRLRVVRRTTAGSQSQAQARTDHCDDSTGVTSHRQGLPAAFPQTGLSGQPSWSAERSCFCWAICSAVAVKSS